MSERKINLEEILKNNLSYSANLIKITSNSNGVDIWKGINDSMLEFGEQLLKLALENAEISLNDNVTNKIWKQKYFNFKNFGCKYSAKIDRQSILDTIKQIE